MASSTTVASRKVISEEFTNLYPGRGLANGIDRSLAIHSENERRSLPVICHHSTLTALLATLTLLILLPSGIPNDALSVTDFRDGARGRWASEREGGHVISLLPMALGA
jgi:hypothetical protein